MHIGSACGVFELNIRSNTSTIGLILVAIPARIYANMAAVTLENGYRLTAQSIPNLVFNPYQTMSSSYSQDQFVGALRHWTQFESQVRENFITLQPHLVQNILSVCATQPRHNDVCFEQLLCGDESTVAARFNQHVGHVMTSVVQELGVDSRFGDSRCSLGVERVRSVPDFAFIDRNGQALLIGEAKTPWIHNLERAIQYGGASGPSLNLVLGQIARYMQDFSLRYAFLTTYEQTIFLKQEQDSDGSWALHYSNAIQHATVSDLQFANPRDPPSCEKRVSVRECMLFLIWMTSGGRDSFLVGNKPGLQQWVITKKGTGRDKSDSSKGSGRKRRTEAGSSSRAVAGPSGSSRYTASNGHASAAGPAIISLYEDTESGKYCFVDESGLPKWAGKVYHDKETDQTYIVVDGESRRAKLPSSKAK